jgi:hypothetical protein
MVRRRRRNARLARDDFLVAWRAIQPPRLTPSASRALSDTFAGIAPADVLAFIIAQLAGMLVATLVVAWLWPKAHRCQCGPLLSDALKYNMFVERI